LCRSLGDLFGEGKCRQLFDDQCYWARGQAAGAEVLRRQLGETDGSARRERTMRTGRYSSNPERISRLRRELAMKRKKRRLVSSLDGKGLRAVDEQMVELSMLLPSSQAAPLEREANRRGVTPGQLGPQYHPGFFLVPDGFSSELKIEIEDVQEATEFNGDWTTCSHAEIGNENKLERNDHEHAWIHEVGHWPSLLSAFLYFDISFMVWVLLGALANSIVPEFKLNDAERGLMLALPLLGGSIIRLLLGLMTDHIGARRTGIIGLGLTLVPLVLVGCGRTASKDSAGGPFVGGSGSQFRGGLALWPAVGIRPNTKESPWNRRRRQ